MRKTFFFAILLYKYIISVRHDKLKYQQLSEEVSLKKRADIARRKKRQRSCWVKSWLSVNQRNQLGHNSTLINRELRHEDVTTYKNYLKISTDLFDEILSRITPSTIKPKSRYREPLSLGLKLALTLRHLALGDNYPTLSYAFRCSCSSICHFVPEICRAIVGAYKDEVISCPVTSEEWKSIAHQFEKKWNVPHAIEALDGKLIAIKKPAHSGKLYHNYMGFFSIPLLALVDAHCKFIWIELGSMGHMSDSKIFHDSELFECLEDNSIGIPSPSPMADDNTNRSMLYFILCDDAFALRLYMMI